MKLNRTTRRLIIGIIVMTSITLIAGTIAITKRNQVPKELLQTVDRSESTFENHQEWSRNGHRFTVINKPVTDNIKLSGVMDALIENTVNNTEFTSSLVIDWNTNLKFDRYLNLNYVTITDKDIKHEANYIIDLQSDGPFDPKSVFTEAAIEKYKIENNGTLVFKDDAILINDQVIAADEIQDVIANDLGPYKPRPVVIPEPEPKPDPKPTPTPPSTTLPNGRKIVAFTFDDGPSNKVTPIVMDIAEQYKAKVTFFALGLQIEKFPDIAKDVVNRGHQLASHTFDHKDLVTLTKDQQLDQIVRTEALIRNTAGYTKEVMVRPPYGSNNASLLSNVPKMYVNWSVDTLDWKSRDAQSVCNSIVTDTKPGDIILLHDIYESTAEGFRCGIEKLAQQGYEFMTVDELFKVYGMSFNQGQLYKKGVN